MAEFNTRIQLKYDTYENWTTNNPTLKAGEVAIATVPSNQDGVQNAPSILIKVGDGTSDYKTLKFISGLAADVHGWAKEAKKPTYQATEITGIGDYIANYVDETLGISVDTDTQYRITKVDDYNYKLQSKAKGEADTAFADVSTITIPKYDDTEVKEDIEALEALVGTTAVATQIGNAITALDLANTYAAKEHTHDIDDVTGLQNALDGKVDDGEFTELDNKVTSLIGNDANKSVRTIAAEELAAQLIPETAKESLDTLEEISAWIQSHPDDAAAMNASIDALEAIVAGIGGEGDTHKTVVAYVTAAIEALKIGDYAKAADLTALAGRVDSLETRANGHESAIGALDKKLNGFAETDKSVLNYIDGKDNEIKETVSGISEKVTELHNIAFSGSTDDLVQGTDTIIFNCGSSNF